MANTRWTNLKGRLSLKTLLLQQLSILEPVLSIEPKNFKLKGIMSAGEHARWGYANYFQLSKFYCFLHALCDAQGSEI